MALNIPTLDVHERTDNPGQDRSQRRQDQVARTLSRIGFLQGTFLDGLEQTDGSITEGISFTANQTRELPHGLGRQCQGFIVVDCTNGAPLLVRGASTSGLEASHIKLTQGASSAFTGKLWVF